MKLYLMRHGEALPASESMQRPLSENGHQEVILSANLFRKNNIEIKQIYHSGILRAQQTAEAVASILEPKPIVDVLAGLQPEDSVKDMSVYCNHWQQDVILVGHLPFMGCLASQLLFDRLDLEPVRFATASVLCLERIAMFQWTIKWFIKPNLLRPYS